MSSAGQLVDQVGFAPCLVEQRWYAVQTRARHEKKAAAELQLRGVETYLPMVTETHYWSDRRKQVELPLFSSYIFVRIPRTPETRMGVLTVGGVISFVGAGKLGEPIADSEVGAIRALIASKTPFSQQAFLSVGQHVRVLGGALDGVEGILSAVKGRRQLVISIEAIHRSLSVCVEGYGIEILASQACRA